VTGRRSAILELGVAAAGAPLLLFSVYLLAAGHNQPGGGFAGGLVAGVVVVLAWSAGGEHAVRSLVPIRSSALLGTGLSLAAITGFASVLAGGAFLESGYVELSIPLVGTVKIVSALVFDTGVYLTVVGMTLALVRAIGLDEESAEGSAP
jgi:multisubunit Na+/H+ antiporter MnhB subunit